MTPTELRGYQHVVIANFDAARMAGKRRSSGTASAAIGTAGSPINIRIGSDNGTAWGAVAEPIIPTLEVRRWVKSRQIAYAKRRSA